MALNQAESRLKGLLRDALSKCARCDHEHWGHACFAARCMCAFFREPEVRPFEIGDKVRFKGPDGAMLRGLIVHNMELREPNTGARYWRLITITTDSRVQARIEAAASHFELDS